MQVNNSQPSFGSTIIKLKPDDFLFENKYMLKVAEHFNMKGLMASTNKYYMKPQLMADQIELSQAAVSFNSNNELLIVGKSGGKGGEDTFIGKLLKESFPNDDCVKFTDDIAPLDVEG